MQAFKHAHVLYMHASLFEFHSSFLCCQEGEHDFRNFCKVDPVNVSNFVRKLFRVSLHRQNSDGTVGSLEDCEQNGDYDDETKSESGFSAASAAAAGSAAAKQRNALAKEREIWFFEVQGQAFLWHQVIEVKEKQAILGLHSYVVAINDFLFLIELCLWTFFYFRRILFSALKHFVSFFSLTLGLVVCVRPVLLCFTSSLSGAVHDGDPLCSGPKVGASFHRDRPPSLPP